ncbi:hypothetical protein BC938DRAFT_478006, partial [Jimgerdemannia flammicorona]
MGSQDNSNLLTHNTIPLPLSFEESTTTLLSASMDVYKPKTVAGNGVVGDEKLEKTSAVDNGRKSDSGVYVDTTQVPSKQQHFLVEEEESVSSLADDIYGGLDIEQDEAGAPEDHEANGLPDSMTLQKAKLAVSTVNLNSKSLGGSISNDGTTPESPSILLSPPTQPEFSLATNSANATHPGSFLRRQPSVHVTPPTSPNIEAFDSTMPSLAHTATISSLLEQEAAVLASTKETSEDISIETSDPSHLFWVPASQHPEIAPAEFNHWLKKHGYTSSNREGASRIKRRKSILSVSYKPEDLEAEGEPEEGGEEPRGVEDKRRGARTRPGFTLDILEEDYVDRVPMPPKRLAGQLRRSVSLNVPQVRDAS